MKTATFKRKQFMFFMHFYIKNAVLHNREKNLKCSFIYIIYPLVKQAFLWITTEQLKILKTFFFVLMRTRIEF